MGILLVEEFVVKNAKGVPHYTSNRYHFTKLLIDSDNEELRQELLSRPIRKSKAIAKTCYHGKVVAYIEPSTLTKRTNLGGGGVTDDTITHQDFNQEYIYNIINTRQNPPNDTQNPAGVVKNLDKDLRFKEAKEVLSVYAKQMGPAGQRSREDFIAKFMESSYDKNKLIENIAIMAKDPLIKFTTLSPTRLFIFEDKVLPMRDTLLKTIKSHCQWHQSIEMVVDSLLLTKIVETWFYARAKNWEGIIKVLTDAVVRERL
jgi:hypothetical protein